MDALPEALPLDAHLCYAIYSANIAINRVYRPVLERLGLTYPQYLVMNVLWEKEGQSIGAIAERLALESSTVTPLVKRLEAAALVQRERNPQDERQVIVSVSPRGAALEQDARCLAATLVQQAGQPVAELAKLTAEVRRLTQSLMGKNDRLQTVE